MLRTKGFVAALSLLTVTLVTSIGAASSAIQPDDYVGEWTADTSSSSQVAAQVFGISSSDEASAREVTGTNAINFDVYCKSTNPNVKPVTYFTATTTSFGTFGGCVSGKTGGHLYTWNTGQVWYAHTEALKGEPLLNGTIEVEHDGGNNDNYKFRAHHPSVQFLAHVRFTQILGHTNKHVVELTTVAGAGEFRLVKLPTSCAAGSQGVVGGEGALTVRSVKIGGPSVVELDSLTIKPDAEQVDADATYNCDDGQSLQPIAVTVTKADPAEKEACHVGATGMLLLVDGGTRRSDSLLLYIPTCHVGLVFKQSAAKKGSHVAIAMTPDEKGY